MKVTLKLKPGEGIISWLCLETRAKVVLRIVQRNASARTWFLTHYLHFPKRPSGSWHPGTAEAIKGWSFPRTRCWPTGLTGILCHSQSCLLTWPSSKTIKSHEVSSFLLKAPQQLHSFSQNYVIKIWPCLLCAPRLRKHAVRHGWTAPPTARSTPQAWAHRLARPDRLPAGDGRPSGTRCFHGFSWSALRQQYSHTGSFLTSKPQDKSSSKRLLLSVAIFYTSYFQDRKNKKTAVQPPYRINTC